MQTLTKETMDRRSFLGGAVSGLTLAFFLPEVNRMGELDAATGGTAVNSWLQIGADESITLTIGSSEMGQGSFSGLAQILAEDLMVDYARVTTVQGGPTLASPAPVGTSINTVGSSVIRTNFWKMRDAAAAAREMLVQAAMAAAGDTARANFTVANGIITHTPDGKTWTYGSVALAASALPLPTVAPLVPDAQFRLIGKTMPRFDIPHKVDGSAIYGLDIRVPNMVYAVIKHCPSFGGTLAKTPVAPAGYQVVPTKVMAGTNRGLEAVGNVNAVAVVGPNTWDTWQKAKQLSVSWTLPANAAQLNDAQFLADAKALAANATPYAVGAANGPGTLYTVEGNADTANAAIAGASKVVDATYTLPYVSHACMEVLNCTVDYVPGVKCEVWAPTQSAKAVMSLVAALIPSLTPAQITIHTTYLGGGLGRKAEVDFVSQAVQVAMVVGKPVKLMWPREEDFSRDQYRPMALVHAKAGLTASGQVLGWSYRNISPSILAQRGSVLGAKGDSQGYEASQALPYNFGTRLTEYVTHPSQIPVGFWRSVGASINTFAVESMVDELAVAAGQDGYTFRRGLLTDPRWIAVLDAAAKLGWNTPLAAGHYRGIAIGTAFNSIVAEVVEISSVTATGLKVNSVSIAMDCYLAVNPGQIDAQLTGGMVHGLNAALYGRQSFVNGAAQSKNFNKSRMIRPSEMPQVSVALIPNPGASDRTKVIGGVGELGVPTFAPALANAYYAATKKRVRALPFFPNATMSD